MELRTGGNWRALDRWKLEGFSQGDIIGCHHADPAEVLGNVTAGQLYFLNLCEVPQVTAGINEAPQEPSF